MWRAPTRASGLGLALMLGVGATVAAPDSRAQTQQTVSVNVLIARADSSPGRDDVECRELRRQLGPMQVGGLHLVEKRQFRLRFGENGAILLPAGGEVRVMPINIHKRRLHMQLQMPGRMNARMQMRAGKPVILVGPRHHDGYIVVQIVPLFPVQE